MKKSIYTLVLIAIVVSACQKELAPLPNIKQIQDSQKANAIATGDNDSAHHTIHHGDTSATINAALDSVSGNLKIRLVKDAINGDEAYIGFDPTANALYIRGEDAPYLQGFGQVSFSTLSSDNIPLAVNMLPLTRKGLTLGLNVNAKTDGTYSLDMEQINNIPDGYQIWLKDNYKKDSLDFRLYNSYAFDIAKADTGSFGSHRFTLVLRTLLHH